MIDVELCGLFRVWQVVNGVDLLVTAGVGSRDSYVSVRRSGCKATRGSVERGRGLCSSDAGRFRCARLISPVTNSFHVSSGFMILNLVD